MKGKKTSIVLKLERLFLQTLKTLNFTIGENRNKNLSKHYELVLIFYHKLYVHDQMIQQREIESNAMINEIPK